MLDNDYDNTNHETSVRCGIPCGRNNVREKKIISVFCGWLGR